MRLSLTAKRIIAFFAIAAVGLAALLIFYRLTEKQAVSSQVTILYGQTRRVATETAEGRITDAEPLRFASSATNADFWIVDMSGRVLLASGSTKAPAAIPSFLEVVGDGTYQRGTFGGVFSQDVLTVFAPIMEGLDRTGYVVAHYPTRLVAGQVNQMMLFSYIIYGIMVLASAIFFILNWFFEVRAIEKVKTAAQEFANGNLSYPLDAKRHDEIGDLAAAEKDLASQLSTASDDQHKFLANVSHDFRSPLTSIRGYVGAIQDGTIPPELQGKYLNIVMSETERLTNLANDLLDLNQLERGVLLNRSDFDINDLIREILPTFEGRANEKKIMFDLTFDAEHLFVNADKDRIKQVVYNLVDNALKFSSQNSEINVQTASRGGKIFISVRDHGVGIEKENLPKIWTRFYKTDPSRGKDKKGTGLGLSIVREIMQAHKENIDVISTPGVGTEFIFTLSPGQEN